MPFKAQDTTNVGISPDLLKLGITGADFTLPIFDGLSTNPSDYLIDIDTDSMEKYPDVRIYFWMIGDELQRVGLVLERPPELEPPETHREAYDERLVQAGRLHLKESKAKGEG
jgi:hypothetical protein